MPIRVFLITKHCASAAESEPQMSLHKPNQAESYFDCVVPSLLMQIACLFTCVVSYHVSTVALVE